MITLVVLIILFLLIYFLKDDLNQILNGESPKKSKSLTKNMSVSTGLINKHNLVNNLKRNEDLEKKSNTLLDKNHKDIKSGNEDSVKVINLHKSNNCNDFIQSSFDKVKDNTSESLLYTDSLDLKDDNNVVSNQKFDNIKNKYDVNMIEIEKKMSDAIIVFNDNLSNLFKEDVGTGKLEIEELNFDSSILPLLMKNFIAFDCETTGLYSNLDRIIEISAVRFENGVPFSSFSSLVKTDKYIPEEVTQINHITNDMVANAPDELSVFKAFLDFLNIENDNVILCAHNAEFDVDFLKSTFKRIGLNASFSYLDTLKISRSRYIPCENRKLLTLAKYYDLADEQSHRAEDDALLCGKLLMVFVNEELDKLHKIEEQNKKRQSIVINPINNRISLSKINSFNNKPSKMLLTGNDLRKSGKIEEAIKYFDKVRMKGCCDYNLYEFYALAYRKLKDYDNEIDILDEAILQCERKNCIGNIQNFRDRRDKAIDLFLKKKLKEKS